MLAISALGPMIAPLLWMIDAWLQPDTDWLVYIAGIALSLTAVGGPAQTAMLADLVTPAERGFCFPVLHAVQKAAPLAAQVIGVAALSLHLQDYTAFWAIMFATQVVIIFVLCTYLPETLPAHKQRPKGWRRFQAASGARMPCTAPSRARATRRQSRAKARRLRGPPRAGWHQ